MTRRTDLGRGDDDNAKQASQIIRTWLVTPGTYEDLIPMIAKALDEAEERGRRSCGALSAEDSKALMDLLDNPPPPSPKLVELLREYRPAWAETAESEADDRLTALLVGLPASRRRRVLDRVRAAMVEGEV